MPTTISMRDFIASGRFGSIQLGVSRAEVEALLGPPHAWSEPGPLQAAAIWKYGGVEFYFGSGVLWMIFCDDFGSPCTQINCWILQRGLSLVQAEAELQAAAIQYSQVDVPNLPGDVYLACASGVQLQFAPAEGEALELAACFIRI